MALPGSGDINASKQECFKKFLIEMAQEILSTTVAPHNPQNILALYFQISVF